MKPSLKAALLSALIFPGVGQLYAGYKKRGWLIIAANAVLVYFIISEVMNKAYQLVAEIQLDGNVIDIEKISNASAKITEFSDNTFINVVLILLIISWLFATIDAYRIAGKLK
jgi:TM2 domain-containing membrane protein YozV